jgi:hypothetical protein
MIALNTFTITETNLSDNMEEKWKVLHEELLRETRHTLRGSPITLEHAESGYKIALGYWQKVKALVRENGFGTEVREIVFFSSVKPFFTSQLEYFLLIYQCRLYCAPSKPDTSAFYQHELDKIQRFRDVHSSFLSFYRSRKKDPLLAQQYFLRRSFDPIVVSSRGLMTPIPTISATGTG